MSLKAYEQAKKKHKQASRTRVPASPSGSGSEGNPTHVIQTCAEVRERLCAKQRAKSESEEKEKRDRSRVGCMYFLLEESPVEPKHVKIGWSAQVPTRKKSLATGQSWPIRIVGIVPNVPLCDDITWKKRFAHLRVWDAAGTEWFLYKEDLREFVESLHAD